MSGELYEVKVASLLFLRGLRNQQDFHLASNMDAAGSFDDVVFTLGNKTVFIQLKHREKQQSKIYTSQLIQFKGDFSLLKYCKSYFDIKKQWKKEKDLQNCGRFEDCLFVVFTNAGLVEGVGSDVGSTEMQDVINTEGKCICFTEDIDRDIYKVFNNLPQYKHILTEVINCEEITDSPELLEIIQKLYNNNAKQVPSKSELSKLLKDLQSLGDLSHYQEFLSNMRFFTEQKSEKDMNSLIRNEIMNLCGTDAVLDKFMLGMQNWWKNTNLYLTESTNFWQEILTSCASKICKQIVDLGVKFSENECECMRAKLSSGSRIMHLKTSCMQLSITKILQSFNTKLLVDVSTLQNHLNEVLAVWRAGTLGDLLVVDGCADSENILQAINDVLDVYLNKRLVFVIQTDTEHDDNFNLYQFDQETQDKILDSKVTFQGSSVNLRDLADTSTLSEGITADIVMHLLSDPGSVVVGQKAVDLDPSYISRTLLRTEYVSKRIFTDENLTLAVSGVSVDEMQELLPSGEKFQIYDKNTYITGINSRYFIIGNANDFAELCEFNSNIHWIHKKNKQFVWKNSQGELAPIKKYVEERVVSYKELENVLELPQKLFVIVGEPGVGKSTEMTYLNELLKRTDPSMWVVRVDLNDFSKYFNQRDCNPIELLTMAGKFVNNFDKFLLEYQINCGGNITLIFDGFDEISPKYSEKVLSILKELLCRKIKNIWITSRFLIKEDLEMELNSLVFKFQHFTTSDENRFLLKFWKIPDSDHKLDNFIVKLLELTRKSLNDKLVKLTGVPLHMKMLAEAFERQAFHYYKTGEIDLPHKLDLLLLYTTFIDRKWEVYYSKINIDVTKVGLLEDYEEIREMFKKKLMNFALLALLGEDDLKLLNNSERIITKIQEYLGKFKAGRERTGIVIDVVQDMPVFVHKTFAEYFVALWFSQNFDSNLEYFRNAYVKKEFQISRNFFDRIMAENCNLHIAVINQNRDLVKKILTEENYKVNDRDNGGRTALHLAIANYLDVSGDQYNNLLYIIKILLNHGADSSTKDNVLCWSPLHFAEEIGAWSIVGLLVERRANTKDLVVITQNYGNDKFIQNILRIAAIEGFVKLVAFMLECGVDIEQRINLKDDNVATMLHIAAAHKQMRFAKFLLENKANIEAHDVFMQTPLMWAAKCGYVKMAKLLLKFGARMDTRDRVQNTAFLYAVLHNKLKMMKVFKEHSSDNKVYDIYGEKALHYAANSGYVDWIECLLDSGIDVDSRTVAHFTPLMVASMNGRLNFVECLIKHGADVNAGRENGKTPVWYAACYGHCDVIKLLHQHGADFTVCNGQGSNILHAAAWSGDFESVKFILDLKFDVNSRYNNEVTALLLAARKGNVKVVQYLLEQGADINVKEEGGNTVLHEAAVSGNVDCVNYLLSLGLDVDSKNNKKSTPLLIAAKFGKLKVVNLLVEHGADLHVHDDVGNTVLHTAASKGQLDVVKWLVDAGINLTVQNSVGKTAAEIAERSMACCLSSHDKIKFSAVIEFLKKSEEECV